VDRDLRITLSHIVMMLAIIMSWITPYPWYTDVLIIFVMILGGNISREAKR
jgi:hypothetical protein